MDNVDAIISDLNNLINTKGKDFVLYNFEKTIIASKNPYLAYYFLKEAVPSLYHDYVRIIIDSHDNDLIYKTILLENISNNLKKRIN